MRRPEALPHPRGPLMVGYVLQTTSRSATELGTLRRAHSRIGVGIEAVVIKIAQAVIAEAEPYRRRFPNFACGRSVLADP